MAQLRKAFTDANGDAIELRRCKYLTPRMRRYLVGLGFDRWNLARASEEVRISGGKDCPVQNPMRLHILSQLGDWLIRGTIKPVLVFRDDWFPHDLETFEQARESYPSIPKGRIWRISKETIGASWARKYYYWNAKNNPRAQFFPIQNLKNFSYSLDANDEAIEPPNEAVDRWIAAIQQQTPC